MAEYIDKEIALSLVQPDAPEDDTAAITIATAKKLVRYILHHTPAADVAPVVHGKWDDSFDSITPYCSVCGMSHSCMRRTPLYCPNCGAKMDGDIK